MKRYGHFDRENDEYVITDPRTPLPWMNYLFNDDYYCLISHLAGGYSFFKNARDRRVLRYRFNNLPQDRPGRYVYVRDDDVGDYWSATWAPVSKDLRRFRYECRHGFGYTAIAGRYAGIATRVTYFVPLRDNVEVWAFSIANRSRRRRRLTLFPYAEFCLWDALMDMTDFQYVTNIAECRAERNIVHHLTSHRRYGFYAFLGTSADASGHDCDREAFVGANRSEADPRAVVAGRCSGSEVLGGNPVGAFAVPVVLKPGETREMSFVLGVAAGPAGGRRLLRKYSDPRTVRRALDAVRASWRVLFRRQQVRTPDRDVNLVLNRWNAYQCNVTVRVSRGPSIYEGGIGRGIGFRDSTQDALGATYCLPAKTRALLTLLLSKQFRSGGAVHDFFPGAPDAPEPSDHMDIHLWLFFSIPAYVKETGDLGFLSRKVPWVDGGRATVLEHMERAIAFTLSRTGRHKLPLIGFSDWNDCLQMPGPNHAAESVMIACLAVNACKAMAELLTVLGDRRKAAAYKRKAQAMARTVNRSAWDGQWYRRAYDDDSRPIGSRLNRTGRIYQNVQSFAVIAQVAGRKRAPACMDAGRKYCNSRHGLMILYPGYRRFDPKLVGITTYPAGLKENAGIFGQVTCWAMMAECLLGRGDYAFEYYKKLLPTEYDKAQAVHRCEPYVYCQYLAGSEHPDFGAGRNSWLTGTSTWSYYVGTHYLLGVRPEYAGLRVDPCIPRQWKGFSVARDFRGARYEISVANPARISKGKVSIRVDGEGIAGGVIPPHGDGKTHDVQVTMRPA